MKRATAIVAALASGFALSAAAQTAPSTASAAAPKVAVIAFQAAVTATNEFQRAYGDLQKKFEPQRTQLQTLSSEIDTLTKQLQTTGDKLSDSDREAKAREIDDKKKQAQRVADDAQTDFQQQLQDNFGKVASKVAEVLNTYSKEQGFTLVIDASEQQQQQPLVLYASPSTDITKTIVDAYNAKSGIPAPVNVPSAPSPSASKPPAQ